MQSDEYSYGRSIFFAQSANLVTVWKIKKAGKCLRSWGDMHVSEEGFVFWTRGERWFLLA